MEEAIKGLNQEKLILATRLGELTGGNKDIDTRSSIEYRLREIDEMIIKIINNITK